MGLHIHYGTAGVMKIYLITTCIFCYIWNYHPSTHMHFTSSGFHVSILFYGYILSIPIFFNSFNNVCCSSPGNASKGGWWTEL